MVRFSLSFSKCSHPYAGRHLISPCGWGPLGQKHLIPDALSGPQTTRLCQGEAAWAAWHISVKLEQASAKQGSQQRSRGDCLGLKSDHVSLSGENNSSHSAVGEAGEA